MTVSLEHLSLEEIIRASGVSRASAYRIWPNKQRFLADVPAGSAGHPAGGRPQAEVAQLVACWMPTPACDRCAGAQRCHRRRAADCIQADFERIASSPQWATYLSLNATCRGLVDSSLREEVATALAEMQEVFIDFAAPSMPGFPCCSATGWCLH